MAKVGDRVRFLNATGGGIITKIDGKTAFVEDEDGFESPILLKDIVVVLPAGHEATIKNSSIMFDQKAFDDGRKTEELKAKEPVKEKFEEKESPLPIEETKHGDNPTLVLAFEPDSIKNLSNTRFTGVLVNDSNYYIDFTFLKRSSEDRGWELIFNGTVNPNELIDMVVISHDDLAEYGRLSLQGIAYKKEKTFSLVPPINVIKKLDLTKFHKLHCFRESKYFDSPVLEFPLINFGETIQPPDIDVEKLKSGFRKGIDKNLDKELHKKYDLSRAKKIEENTLSQNPFKKLPLIEVDLHIGELMDSLTGMEPKDILERQLDEVKKTMSAHSKRIGQKIVFIHGKGEGVLRKAVLELLKKDYPKAELQDASFREYGFGATLVTVH